MLQGDVEDGVVPGQTLDDDGVGALAVEPDLPVGATDDGGHALSGRVELAHGEKVVVQGPTVDRDRHRPRFAGGEAVAEEDGPLDEGALIGGGGLIADPVGLVLASFRDDGVAGGQQGEEMVKDVGGLMRSDVLPESGEIVDADAVAVAVAVSGDGPTIVGDVVGILKAGDGTLLELHLIAGQGAGLVGEDVLDLTEFLDQAGRSADGGGIALIVVDVQIGVDEQGVRILDQVDGDEKGDGDQVGVEDPVGEDVGEELSAGADVVRVEVG